MTESCTIYCKVLSLGRVAEVLDSFFDSHQLVGAASFSVCGDVGALRISARVFEERGDDFCKLLRSTYVSVQSLTTVASDLKARVIEHVESCELVLGVVADPSFDSDDRFNSVIFAIGKLLDGMVFNGNEMLSADGEVLAVWA